MTIVAFHFTEDGFFAIADGLISRGQARVLEQTQKIIKFRPVYKIPIVGLGRLSGFRTYQGETCCICFAGNYSIISSVLDKFNEIISRKLVLYRDDNFLPKVYQREDEGEGLKSNNYSDTFNFFQEDLVPITVNFLANILQRVISEVCIDFSKNAMLHPDIELLLFGEQKIRYETTNAAQVLICKEVINSTAIIERYSVLPWRLVCIGDKSVINPLIQKVEGDKLFKIQPSAIEMNDSWIGNLGELHQNEKNKIKVIKRNVLEVIQKGTLTVGGDCTVVSSGWSSKLSIKTIKYDEIDGELVGLM